jgi:hypothetical protein
VWIEYLAALPSVPAKTVFTRLAELPQPAASTILYWRLDYETRVAARSYERREDALANLCGIAKDVYANHQGDRDLMVRVLGSFRYLQHACSIQPSDRCKGVVKDLVERLPIEKREEILDDMRDRIKTSLDTAADGLKMRGIPHSRENIQDLWMHLRDKGSIPALACGFYQLGLYGAFLNAASMCDDSSVERLVLAIFVLRDLYPDLEQGSTLQ